MVWYDSDFVAFILCGLLVVWVVIKVCLLAGIGGFAFACGFLVLVVRLVF